MPWRSTAFVSMKPARKPSPPPVRARKVSRAVILREAIAEYASVAAASPRPCSDVAAHRRDRGWPGISPSRPGSALPVFSSPGGKAGAARPARCRERTSGAGPVILVDAGPLVALADRSDSHHAACGRARGMSGPLATVCPRSRKRSIWFSGGPGFQAEILTLVETGALWLLPVGREDMPRVRALMEKYRDSAHGPRGRGARACVAERERCARSSPSTVVTLGPPPLRPRKFKIVP